jgi:hypothetical protein
MMRHRSKFNAKPTEVEGIRFASRLEATHYGFLRLREKAGEIRNLELQPRYPFVINGQKICEYRADFKFEERFKSADGRVGWRFVTADSKGVRTRVFAIKAKLLKAIYGIDIREL